MKSSNGTAVERARATPSGSATRTARIGTAGGAAVAVAWEAADGQGPHCGSRRHSHWPAGPSGPWSPAPVVPSHEAEDDRAGAPPHRPSGTALADGGAIAHRRIRPSHIAGRTRGNAACFVAVLTCACEYPKIGPESGGEASEKATVRQLRMSKAASRGVALHPASGRCRPYPQLMFSRVRRIAGSTGALRHGAFRALRVRGHPDVVVGSGP